MEKDSLFKTPASIELTDYLQIYKAIEFFRTNRICDRIELFACDSGRFNINQEGSRQYLLYRGKELLYRINCEHIPEGEEVCGHYEIIPQDAIDLTNNEVQEIQNGLQALLNAD